MIKVREILTKSGYFYNENAGDVDRFFLAKGKAEKRTYNIHVELYGGMSWHNHIDFKNFLLKHPDYIEKYCKVKQELEACYKNDRLKYTQGKAGFIQSIIKNIH